MKSPSNKHKGLLATTFTDNDTHCLFYTTLFQEVLHRFEITNRDPLDVFPYTVEEISKRQQALQHKIKLTVIRKSIGHIDNFRTLRISGVQFYYN